MTGTKSWSFRYRVGAVRVHLPPDASGLDRFLTTYFEPFFEVNTHPTDDSVDAEIDIVLSVPPPVAPDFAQGNQIVVDRSKGFLNMTGRQVDRSDGRWVALQPSGAVIHIPVGKRQVRVFAPAHVDIRIVVLRLVEDIILNAVQNAGAIVLHSAAVVADGLAVAAVGNKGAGKTSFLCHSLEGFVTTELTSDNVCVFLTSRGVTLRGWPSFFKACLGTIISHDALVDSCPPSAALSNDGEVWATYEKVAMYPQEAATAFGAQITPEAPLGQLILPMFSREGPVGLVPVAPQDVKDELAGFLQGVHNPNHPEWLGINPVDRELVAAGLAHFVDSLQQFGIPVVRVRWAPALRDLLRRLPIMRQRDRLLNRARSAKRSGNRLPLP